MRTHILADMSRDPDDVSLVITELPLPGVGVGRPAVAALTLSLKLKSSCDCQSNAYATRSEDCKDKRERSTR
jgi:hypothetical protein